MQKAVGGLAPTECATLLARSPGARGPFEGASAPLLSRVAKAKAAGAGSGAVSDEPLVAGAMADVRASLRPKRSRRTITVGGRMGPRAAAGRSRVDHARKR